MELLCEEVEGAQSLRTIRMGAQGAVEKAGWRQPWKDEMRGRTQRLGEQRGLQLGLCLRDKGEKAESK